MDEPTPFPFIVGCGRSGTTLVRAMLDAHPDLTVPDEVAFIVRYARPHYAAQYGWPRHFDAAKAATLIAGDSSFERWPVTAEQLQDAVAAQRPGTFAELTRLAYRLAAAEQGTTRYADKTPVNVLHIERLAGLFPEACFVHVVRDGRDVARSYLGVPWGPTTIEEAAVRWRRSVRAGRRAGAVIEPHRYTEVRYEELVSHPEPTMRGVCAFIGLSWDDAVLRHHERAAGVIAATKFPDAHARVALPPTPGLRNWRDELTVEDVARFEAIAGDDLVTMGYELGADPATPTRWAMASGRVATTWARRRAREAIASARVLGRWAGRAARHQRRR